MIYRKEFRKFEDALEASGIFDRDWLDETSRRLGEKIGKHCANPENRDGRGVKHSESKGVRRMLRQLARASRHAEGHENSQVRTSAKSLLRSIQSLSFRQIQGRASKHDGLVRKVGHRRIEAALLSKRPRLEAGGLGLVRLTSVDQLRSAGKELQNCVAAERAYHDELRQDESEFWTLEDEGENLVGLIEVEVETRQIAQCGGREGGELSLQREQALEVLRVLNATGDNVETFSRVGAFSVFSASSSSSDRKKPHLRFESERSVRDGKNLYTKYGFWLFPEQDKFVVGMRQRCVDSEPDEAAVEGSPCWSLFSYQKPQTPDGERMSSRRRRRRARRQDGEWVSRDLGGWEQSCFHEGAMAEGQLLEFMLRYPEICSTIHKEFGYS